MRLRNMLFVLTLVLSASLVISAQEITGQIRGTVTDSTGAVIPNASVTVTNTDRNQVVRTLHTGSAGEYVAPLLPVGTYSVSVSSTGFRALVHKGIVLNVSDRLTIDAQLVPGSGNETVMVEASPDQVNLDTAAVEGLIAGTQVRELPLNNRNYEQLVTLQPGVTSNAADQIYVGTTNPSGQVNIVSFAINGQRQSQNNWTIDGADNVDHGSNITLLVYPSVDAISEFKVERSSYSPEFGRSAGGQINVVTRAGTNQFHGSLYEFFRNDWLNANSPYNNSKGIARPVLRYNDFGGTIGGPVNIPGIYNGKDKTFFFFSEEARRVTTPITQQSSLPTDQMMAGNFSAYPTNSICTAIDATGKCTVHGNSISPANFNPIAAAYIKDVFSKVPTMPGVVRNGNQIIAVEPGIFNYREELYRVDHVLTSKIALMGRFINDAIPTEEPFGLFGPQSNVPGVGGTKTNSPGQQWMGRATFQISEKLYNEVGYAYSYGAILSDSTGLASRTNSPNVAAAVNLPYAVTLNRIPVLVFDDADIGGGIGGFGEYRDYNRNHNLFDNFSWTQGKHAMKFGVSFNHYQKKENAAANNVGTYEFDSTNGSGFEQDWANFLMGYSSSSFTQSSSDFTADVRQNLWEFYGQDQWRIRPNITLTYGMRYSYFQTPWAAGNNLTSFDQNIYNPANAPAIAANGHLVSGTGNCANGCIIGGVNSPYGKYITSQDKGNFAPRLGISWDPTGKGKTSVRAAFGMFYDSPAAGLIEDNIFNNASDSNLGAFMSSPDVAGAGTMPLSIYGTDPNWKSPYTESWNLDVQQEFGKGWFVDVGYVGSNSKHLTGLIDINQVKPGVAQAAGLLANPGTGCVKANGVYVNSSSCGAALNAYRPYVGFGAIGEISPRFRANYNALQTSVKKQFGANTTFGAFYTWSKALTNMQTDRSTGIMYTYCPECDYGRSSLNRAHVFNANFVYDTPWFKSQKGFVGHVLGGWEASGILTVQSGLPLTVLGNASAEGDPMASGYYSPSSGYGRISSIRPNQVGDPNSNAPHTWTQWFNTSAFAYPTAYGSVPTEHRGSVTGPGMFRYDMAMMKNVRLAERVNLQLRAEGFNLFNHANPTTIGTTMGSSTFGKVTGSRDGRTVQLAAKILF